MGLLDSIRKRNPETSAGKILWYSFCRRVLWFIMKAFYGFVAMDARKVPAEGSVLVVSNHQSYLDLLCTCGLVHRNFQFLARATLFRNPFFGGLIRSLNAFPVEQGKGDIGAMRASIEMLKKNKMLLVFPEGSRTVDGKLQLFQEGILLLVRRAKPTVVPMAVDGVYDIWPIGATKPKLSGRAGAIWGDPIPAEELLAVTPEEAMARLRREVEALRLKLRGELRRRSGGKYPPPGPGDVSAV